MGSWKLCDSLASISGFSLAGFNAIGCSIQLIYLAFALVTRASSHHWRHYWSILLVSIHGIHAIVMLLGIVALRTRSAGIMFAFAVGLQVILLCLAASFIGTLLCALICETSSSSFTEGNAVLILAGNPLIIIVNWFMLSAALSLRKIFTAGGTGWERMNYEQVRDVLHDPYFPAVQQ